MHRELLCRICCESHGKMNYLAVCTCISGCVHTYPMYIIILYLTHWGRDKVDAISQTTFSNAFSWMKMYEFHLRFHWSLFLRVQLIMFQHWFRYWLGAVQATSHYLKQCWIVYWRTNESLGLNDLNFTNGDGVSCQTADHCFVTSVIKISLEAVRHGFRFILSLCDSSTGVSAIPILSRQHVTKIWKYIT